MRSPSREGPRVVSYDDICRTARTNRIGCKIKPIGGMPQQVEYSGAKDEEEEKHDSFAHPWDCCRVSISGLFLVDLGHLAAFPAATLTPESLGRLVLVKGDCFCVVTPRSSTPRAPRRMLHSCIYVL